MVLPTKAMIKQKLTGARAPAAGSIAFAITSAIDSHGCGL
jgi:hypothetical protein